MNNISNVGLRKMVLVIIIRDGTDISLKADFIARILKSNHDASFIHVFRKNQFNEKSAGNEIELASSTFGIFMYYFLYFLKSPKDLHDGFVRRLTNGKLEGRIRAGGFVTTLFNVLYQYFGRSSKSDGLKELLERSSSKKIFLVDEFFSLKTVDLRLLQKFGSVIYVTSDVARDFYGCSLATSKIMAKFEQKTIDIPDLIVACSERDRLKYLEMGANEAIFYPNIYPMSEISLLTKDEEPSISIVMRAHWGSLAVETLEEVLKALACFGKSIRVYVIGMKPEKIPKNIDLIHFSNLESRSDFLKTLSRSWFGINLGIHGGGSNQRKYDYALAELVVLSDKFGARGDFLPCEYSYFDYYDLAAKIIQLVALGREEITKMGIQNRKTAISLADKQQKELKKTTDVFF